MRLSTVVVALYLCAPSQAWAQDTRPAGNTIAGDTGLWFVSLGETLPKGRWSGGAQLVNFDRSEGFSDITDIGGMFAFGATDRIEIFGALGYRRLDADLVPVARNGQPQDYLINKGWSTGIGDLTVGAKFNILSQATADGAAIAVRVSAKVPTASRDDGLGTGKPDFQFDLIGSREFSQKVDLALSAGIKVRGSPDGYNLTNGFKWGIGGGFPSRSKLKVIAEMHGEAFFDQEQRYTGPVIPGAGGPPAEWDPDATRDLFGGVQYHATNGMYFGVGLGYTASYYFAPERLSDFGRQRLRSPRLPGSNRLPPRNPQLRATSGGGSADGTRDAGGAGQSSADGEGALRTLHG